jgi:hypothetical protein
MQRRTFLKLGGGAVLGSALSACGGGGNGNELVVLEPTPAPVQTHAVLGWNNVALEAIRTVKPGPQMSARSLAIVHTTMYNAWSAYDPLAKPTAQGLALGRPLAERTADNKVKAISYAAYATLLDQFPTQKAAFDAHMASLGFDPAAVSTDRTTPQGVGAANAANMLSFCHADGANQLGNLTASAVPYADYTSYQPVNPPLVVTQPLALASIVDPGRWQPLTFVDAGGVSRTPGFIGAGWDHVQPFALTSASQFRPAPPAVYGSAEYIAQAEHVLTVQQGLTEQQKVIAEYWSDGPSSELPPGHWCLLAQFVSRRDAHGDEEDVKMFFALTAALADAAIAAWDAKRFYDSVRPITAIRYLMNGKTITAYGPEGPVGGLKQIDGALWTPYQLTTFPTPPIAEYVSGHSTFSAAAGAVLRGFTHGDRFGASYTKPAKSMAVEPGLPAADLTLSWATFTEAVDQAGQSRIYGGIHFDNANVAGKQLGDKVGVQALAKARAYWEGTV